MSEPEIPDIDELLHSWEAETPPPGLAQRTLERIENPPQPGWLERIDGWAERIKRFFEGPPLRTGVLATAAGCVLFLMVWSPNLFRGRAEGDLQACKVRLKVIATAIEAYHDKNGEFPTSIEQLIPGYLVTAKACPAAGKDTYKLKSQAETFTVYCGGHHHPQVEPDHPQYSSDTAAGR